MVAAVGNAGTLAPRSGAMLATGERYPADALVLIQADLMLHDSRAAGGAGSQGLYAVVGNSTMAAVQNAQSVAQSLDQLAVSLRSTAKQVFDAIPRWGVAVMLAGLILFVLAYALLRLSASPKRLPKEEPLRRRVFKAAKRAPPTSLERQQAKADDLPVSRSAGARPEVLARVPEALAPRSAAGKPPAAGRPLEPHRPWWRCACRRRPER